MDAISSELARPDHDIVIIGGGICGLATALALHRKGIRSVVLERAECLRATGAAIGVLRNGWRALHQLGVASQLPQTNFTIQGARELWLDKHKELQIPMVAGDARVLKRSDLINTLANALPEGTIHFGCQVESINLCPQTNYPVLKLHDGNVIVSKILIGCDGARSIVADSLNLKPTKTLKNYAIRGLTHYPNGHSFAPEFVRMRKDGIMFGRAPIDEESVYWFVQQSNQMDSKIFSLQHPELIREITLKLMHEVFSKEMTEIVEKADLDSLSVTHIRYREPWGLLLPKFRKGTITVAGDAMHVMGPFLGQGGSAGLEDAVVLARCLSKELGTDATTDKDWLIMRNKIGEAVDRYVKERRMRLVALSTQTYLTGSILENSSWLMKIVAVIIMAIFFRNPSYHTKYDCGAL